MTREDHDKRSAVLDDWSHGDLILQIVLLEAALSDLLQYTSGADLTEDAIMITEFSSEFSSREHMRAAMRAHAIMKEIKS